MSIADVRMTAIQIVNEVQRKLGLNTTTTFTANKHARILLDLLNDVIDECSDYGDWHQMLREVKLSAISSVGTYKVSASAEIQRIHEVVWANDIAPLEVRNVEDIRRLQRVSSFGKPRQFSIVGVSGVSPFIRVFPVPASATMSVVSGSAQFDILYYKKPRLLVEADTTAAVIPAFPSRVLVQGLYAKAILEESGGERTSEFVAAYREYERMRSEAQNRFNSDTGGSAIYFTPTGRYS